MAVSAQRFTSAKDNRLVIAAGRSAGHRRRRMFGNCRPMRPLFANATNARAPNRQNGALRGNQRRVARVKRAPMSNQCPCQRDAAAAELGVSTGNRSRRVRWSHSSPAPSGGVVKVIPQWRHRYHSPPWSPVYDTCGACSASQAGQTITANISSISTLLSLK